MRVTEIDVKMGQANFKKKYIIFWSHRIGSNVHVLINYVVFQSFPAALLVSFLAKAALLEAN